MIIEINPTDSLRFFTTSAGKSTVICEAVYANGYFRVKNRQSKHPMTFPSNLAVIMFMRDAIPGVDYTVMYDKNFTI